MQFIERMISAIHPIQQLQLYNKGVQTVWEIQQSVYLYYNALGSWYFTEAVKMLSIK